jgi:chemotaxis protein MotB
MTSRRSRHSGHVNHERWLISYADFITLLFAFFVVMFAVARSQHAKPHDVSASVQRAIDMGGVSSTIRQILRSEPVRPSELRQVPDSAPASSGAATAPVDLGPSFEYLKGQLQKEIALGQVQVMMEARGIVVSLREQSIFPSGGDTIYTEAYESIGKIARVLRDLPNFVRLEGHTDSKPIHNSHFHNNWELSAARAIAVLMFFASREQIAANRFAVAGYADNLPVADNESEDGRARNRRVDVVILNGAGLRSEPKPH